jgi:hypothetical protein
VLALADGLASSRERTVAWRREQNSNRRLTKSIVPRTGALEFAGRFVPIPGEECSFFRDPVTLL